MMKDQKPRIALVYPIDSETLLSNNISLGLACIGAVALERGCEVKVFVKSNIRRSYTDEQMLEMIRDFKPDMIGVTVFDGMSILSIYALAQKLRVLKKLIVAGGPHASVIPQELLTRGGFDIVVRGEGEETFAEIIDYWEGKKEIGQILGVTYKNAAGEILVNPERPLIKDIDKLPLPARALFEGLGYDRDAYGSIMMSRGCPYQCTFCSRAVFGMRYRKRSPENILREMIQIRRDFQVDRFLFWDDCFMVNIADVEKLLDLVIAAPELKGISWYCTGGRVNLANRHIFEKMRQAGCEGLSFGIETGDREMLKKIKKSISLDEIKSAVQWACEAGLRCSGYIMYGFPEQGPESLERTFELVRQLSPYVKIWSWTGILIPHAGTEIYNAYHTEYRFTDWWLDQKRGGHLYYPLYSKMHFLSDELLEKDFFRYTPEIRKKIRMIQHYIGRHNFNSRYQRPEYHIHLFFAEVSLFFADKWRGVDQYVLPVLYRGALKIYRGLYQIKNFVTVRINRTQTASVRKVS